MIDNILNLVKLLLKDLDHGYTNQAHEITKQLERELDDYEYKKIIERKDG